MASNTHKNLTESRSVPTKVSCESFLATGVLAALKRASVRILAVLILATGVLVIVSGSGANGVSSQDDDAAKGTRKRSSNVPKTIQKSPNFDIRLTRSDNLARIVNANFTGDGEAAVRQHAIYNKSRIDAAVERIRTVHPKAEVNFSALTGAVEVLRSPDGLTKPTISKSGEDIVRGFISRNRDLYGLNENEIPDLNFIGESVSPESGLRMVRVEQIVNGRPVFQSETRFILDSRGRIVRSLGLMVPDGTANAADLDNLLDAQTAFQRTMDSFGVKVDAGKAIVLNIGEGGYETELAVPDPQITGKVTSKIVYFPAAPGVLIPAWSQIIFMNDLDWYVLVDARDGTVLWRKNIRSDVSTHDARFRVYVQADGTTPADNPAPQSPSGAVPGGNTQFPEIAPSIVTMFTAQNITASPNGWIDDCPGGVCTANETQTLGNNTITCLDRAGTANVCDTDAASVLDGNGRPTGNADVNSRDRDFLGTTLRDFQTNYLPPPQAGNPEAGQTATGAGSSGTNAFDQFRRGAVTHLFYVTNWYHDKLFALGFNTAAGNFQNNNFGGGGTGNDRVLADAQDASGTNNANFSTPPDGTSGRMQMFRFTGSTIDRDGGLDTEIVIHELTHGTSNRLIGNASGLQWDIGAGMGEGWSDFYALSLLNNTNADTPSGNYASGAYATYKLGGLQDNYVYGIRRFPYSTNNAVSPLTWADVDQSTYNQTGGIAVNPLGFEFGGALEVHNAGEIWANTLWEVRSRVIADPAGANGSVPTGNQTMLQIVTDGMKLTPLNPTFIQARDALIDADCATNACANEQWIWDGFADRGLGYGAYSPIAVQFGIASGHIGLAESTAVPNLDINTITVNDTLGNGSGFIDPNEPVRLFINVKNPWRNAAKSVGSATATLTSSTVGVFIANGSTTYPAIAANSNANSNGAVLIVQAPELGVCGSTVNFTLTLTSSLGVAARNFSLRLGQPSGTLAPVTYTRSAVGLAIPDGNGSGAVDTLNVPDDHQIADINVRIDGLTHTFDGDVTAGIRGPNGYGTDVLTLTGWVAGGVFQSGGSPNNNFTNTVFDDEAANDIITAANVTAPYTNSYQAAFNSPTWLTVLLGAAPDATPQLSRFDGTSSLGDWRMVVSDHTAPDAGTLNGWSLIITPQNFVCTAFTPTAASVPVMGRAVTPGGLGISGAVVLLTNSQGESQRARTNPFGYFVFTSVPVGETYILTASRKGYSFVPQVINVNDEIVDLELIGQQ